MDRKTWLSFLLILLISCSTFIGDVALADELVTPEELAKAAGKSTVDFESGVLEEVIKRFSITQESIQDAPESEFADALTQILNTNYQNRYLYMFEAPNENIQFSELNAEDISRIAVYTTSELIYEMALIDFEKETVYVDLTKNFLEDIATADNQFSIDQELQDSITTLMRETSWPDENDDNSADEPSDVLESCEYGISIETKDGVKHIVYHRNLKECWDTIHGIIVLCAGNEY